MANLSIHCTFLFTSETLLYWFFFELINFLNVSYRRDLELLVLLCPLRFFGKGFILFVWICWWLMTRYAALDNGSCIRNWYIWPGYLVPFIFISSLRERERVAHLMTSIHLVWFQHNTRIERNSEILHSMEKHEKHSHRKTAYKLFWIESP